MEKVQKLIRIPKDLVEAVEKYQKKKWYRYIYSKYSRAVKKSVERRRIVLSFAQMAFIFHLRFA